ncbi:pilus assembly protein TadG-related protein [Streptomyces sp. NBC_00287]|uniref:pilus assembly protein TadG-related protein n=1 Tax=Streptomyces sp. NBC_00287 TaxID=2975702 RepID=UPI002E2B00F0|nr:pilus assembly protein TadG-related protein [Streptomyces sp. NBC_00287]
MRSRGYGDAGQAFPIYITVVGGLLFLALAYLAVGQAAANRNGAQTAADAAVLAAAQDTRDQLAGKWVEDVLDPTQWQDIFDGYAAGLTPSCWRAYQLAGQNDAHVEACEQTGPLEYEVAVQMDKPVGDSIVPGTEGKYAKASAIAVIESRCTFELPGEDAGDEVLPQLTCEDRNWDLDPDDLTDLPGPEDLFDVHLAD